MRVEGDLKLKCRREEEVGGGGKGGGGGGLTLKPLPLVALTLPHTPPRPHVLVIPTSCWQRFYSCLPRFYSLEGTDISRIDLLSLP